MVIYWNIYIWSLESKAVSTSRFQHGSMCAPRSHAPASPVGRRRRGLLLPTNKQTRATAVRRAWCRHRLSKILKITSLGIARDFYAVKLLMLVAIWIGSAKFKSILSAPLARACSHLCIVVVRFQIYDVIIFFFDMCIKWAFFMPKSRVENCAFQACLGKNKKKSIFHTVAWKRIFFSFLCKIVLLVLNLYILWLFGLFRWL